MHLYADGTLLIGNHNNRYQCAIGNGRMSVGGINIAGATLQVLGTLNATGSITSSSDIRLKTNIVRMENVLEKLDDINGYTFTIKERGHDKQDIDTVGCIAQEVEPHFPKLIETDDDGFKSMNYQAFTAVLLEAIKDLKNEVTNLKSEIATLKSA